MTEIKHSYLFMLMLAIKKV